jgi:hypothetical protein
MRDDSASVSNIASTVWNTFARRASDKPPYFAITVQNNQRQSFHAFVGSQRRDTFKCVQRAAAYQCKNARFGFDEIGIRY